MTEGNRNRLKVIIKDLQQAHDDNDDGETFIYIIFRSIGRLLVIGEDCHFRPGVNS